MNRKLLKIPNLDHDPLRNFLFTSMVNLVPRGVRQKVVTAGDMASYSDWVTTRYGNGPGLLKRRREHLWNSILQRLAGKRLRGIEFGIGQGYATKWWLKRIDENSRWDGFDRFTGLPREWRNLPVGTFDNGGLPPFDDNRVTWHVGDVEETVSRLALHRQANESWIILFDLDLYEPSICAWNHLEAAVEPGDVLYFDEAFDHDERHLITQEVLPYGRYDLVGWTPVSLAIQKR